LKKVRQPKEEKQLASEMINAWKCIEFITDLTAERIAQFQVQLKRGAITAFFFII
jgi:hypothetical protein